MSEDSEPLRLERLKCTPVGHATLSGLSQSLGHPRPRPDAARVRINPTLHPRPRVTSSGRSITPESLWENTELFLDR
jgi:hypothetical protein